jgi:hypothetical protein
LRQLVGDISQAYGSKFYAEEEDKEIQRLLKKGIIELADDVIFEIEEPVYPKAAKKHEQVQAQANKGDSVEKLEFFSKSKEDKEEEAEEEAEEDIDSEDEEDSEKKNGKGKFKKQNKPNGPPKRK